MHALSYCALAHGVIVFLITRTSSLLLSHFIMD